MLQALENPDAFPTRPPRQADWASPLELFFRVDPGKLIRQWPEPAFSEPYKLIYAAGARFHLVNDPDAVRHVLLENVANYRRPRFLTKIMEIGLGRGLLLAEGELWREQRRLMAPVFTPAAIDRFMPLFGEAAEAISASWPAEGGVLDLAAQTTRTTQDIIVRALFSREPELASETASRLLQGAMAGIGALRLGNLLGSPKFGRTALAKHGDACMADLNGRIRQVIGRRQSMDRPPHDFVTLLMEAFAEKHPNDAQDLTRDNVLTFFAAGHETTAVGLAWTLYLLAGDQAVQDRARAEAIASLADDPSPQEAVRRLTYLRQVWEEALRLYPPAARIDREALGEDELCSRRVRKGDQVVIWPWLIHRHKQLWSNPDAFDPGNFSAQAKAMHHRFQYLPFGAGPRICIGMAFANAEAVLILARWLRRWRFHPAPGAKVEVSWKVTLQPKGGLPLYVTPA